MLVLTRGVKESIRIGDDIVVTVCEFKNGRVRLGIEAPREVPVVRDDAVRSEPTRPAEDDMISAPRAKAMLRHLASLQNAVEHLREENAMLRVQLQNREHVG